MKGIVASALAAATLLSGVAASSHGFIHDKFHKRDQHKRDDLVEAAANQTAVCVTSWVTFYGEPTLVPKAPPPPTTSSTSTSTSSLSTSTSVAPTSTSTSTPPPPPPSSSATAPPPAASPSAAAAGAAYLQNSGSKGQAAISSGEGAFWAMSYTPYITINGGQSQCASSGQVSSDMASIKSKGFSAVRTYANDCSGLVNIANGCKAAGLNMLVGIYITPSGVGASNIGGQTSEIISYFAGDYSMVEMIIVGNEAISSGWASASDLAGALSQVRSSLRSAGYTGPVTSAETLGELQVPETQATLCPQLDILSANLHSYFDPNTFAANAGQTVSHQYAELKTLCNGKPAYVVETGWPSGGDQNSDAIAGPAEQAAAIGSIRSIMGNQVTFFSFYNDGWKAPGSYGVEQFWGCFSLL